MKNRYQRMTKEEKKELRLEYKKHHADLKKKINRVFIIAVFGIIYGIAMFVFDYYRDAVDIWSWIIDGFLMIFCVGLFVYAYNNILLREYNRFAIQIAHNKEEKKRVEKKNNRRKK